jgi:hypothetical protein
MERVVRRLMVTDASETRWITALIAPGLDYLTIALAFSNFCA